MSEQTPKRRPIAAANASSVSASDADGLAQYISDLCEELAVMARRTGRSKLAGLLEMAHNEARSDGRQH